jgi:hypothetical protein
MSIRTSIVSAVAVCFVVALGCNRGPSRIYPPSIDASAAGKQAVEMYGKDGVIAGENLDKCPALKAALAQIDTAGDKTITAEKITARIKAWQNSKLGRMSMSCTILKNGQPLVGADVKFVPEKFLGEQVKEASGKTDQNGVAMISIPTTDRKDPPGVAPGFYRVEVTKAGENIPAMYNTKSIFGQEVALDAAGIREGLKFQLKY